MSDWNCDGSCTVTSVLIQDLEDFYHLIFAAQNVHTLERVNDIASMFKIPTSYPKYSELLKTVQTSLTSAFRSI